MTTPIQRSLAGGEISPSAYGRVDLTKYETGLRSCRNCIVQRHGGAANRPGTVHRAEVKDSSVAARLIRFVFSATQTYILEFGNQYIRFYRNGVQITVSGVAAWAGGTPYVIGDLVVHGGVNYYCIADSTGDTPPNATYWYPLTGSIYEIPTPYLTAELPDLQYVQSADVVTFVHPNWGPRDLARTGHTSWTLSTITFAPTIAAPTGVGVAGTGGADTFVYHLTSYDISTGEESLAVTESQGGLLEASSSNPHTITWTPAADADEYNIYLEVNGVPGYVGSAIGSSFVNDGIAPEFSDTPPVARDPFSGAGNYPSAVAYHQQRLILANTDNNPEGVYGSRTALRKNFTISSPLQDDDAVTFRIAGNQVNEVRHLAEVGVLLVLTTGGEWSIAGDDPNRSGVLTPTSVNPKQHTHNGSGVLAPINVGGNLLYVQARGSIIRDLAFEIQADGYRGNDMTIFASHLFSGYTLVDWAYQQNPHSVVWAVRSDGTLLGMTYLREHQVWGWHRHDFAGGTVENVAVVPDGDEDILYLIVKRTIDGNTVRYIESMTTRQIDADAIEDSIFMDSTLSYDGTHTGSTTMALSGGTTWEYTETITLTASASTFVAGDVGNEIHLTGSTGTVIRCRILGYTSGTVVSVRPHKTVPAGMQAAAISTWGKAVDELTGLGHLEGERVSVFADGFVIGSPNNAAYTVYTVTSGAITLETPRVVIHVGLPVTADIEPLDIDTIQSETLMDKRKLPTKVSMLVEKSRGIWVGTVPPTDDDTDPLEGLSEVKQRDTENYDEPVELATEVVDVDINAGWNPHGRVFIRQVDPIPMTILTIAPSGFLPFRR